MNPFYLYKFIPVIHLLFYYHIITKYTYLIIACFFAHLRTHFLCNWLCFTGENKSREATHLNLNFKCFDFLNSELALTLFKI